MPKSNKKPTRILAIETSCDETSTSIIEIENFDIKNLKLKILSNIVSSQVKLHSKYGGVYPELASREHTKNMIPVLNEALNQSNYKTQIKSFDNLNLNKNLKLEIKNLLSNIDYIAVTTTPGLIGSLLVGVNTAKTLSFTTGIPIILVNHLEGHIYANFITDKISKNQINSLKNLELNKNLKLKIENLPQFPILALVVSGGHTSLYYMKSHMHYELIGETIDDAAGEAYDKVAKMLNLGYPGGPIIDTLASNFSNKYLKSTPKIEILKQCQFNKNSRLDSEIDPRQIKLKIKNLPLFPRPMLSSNNFNFSFSGLKTSVLYYLKGKKITQKLQQEVAYEFQEAVTDVLVAKTLKAAKKYKVKSILLGGGVAANSRLREKMTTALICHPKQTTQAEGSQLKIKNLKLKIDIYIPPIRYCTDNAAVIGAAAAYKLLKEKPHKWYDIEAKADTELS